MITRLSLRSLSLAAALTAFTPLMGASFTSAQAQAPAAPPAAGPNLSASHLAVAQEVVTASGITRSIDAIAPQFAEQVRQTFTATRPEIVKDLDEVLAQLRPEIDKERDDMVAATTRIFATRMTEADLNEVARFFSSDAGKRYVETQPLMLDAMFNEMQAWSQRLSENIVTRVRVEMRKRGHEL